MLTEEDRGSVCISSSGHMGLEYMGLNTPLQTQGGSGGSEALSLSK